MGVSYEWNVSFIYPIYIFYSRYPFFHLDGLILEYDEIFMKSEEILKLGTPRKMMGLGIHKIL